MKRFYCTVCKKMKRVRKYPVNVVASDSITPTDRIGECKYHSNQSTDTGMFAAPLARHIVRRNGVK